MTAALDLHPDAGHPAVVGLARIHAVLDDLDPSVPVSSEEYAALVADCERAVRRLQAVKLRLVAAADQADVGVGSGMSGTGAWLAKQTRSTGATAAGQVALAVALGHLPATEAALAAGEVSAEHASVIAQTTRHLPDRLDDAQRAAVEARLVDQARRLDPAALRKKARQALNAAESQTEADRHHDHVLREEEDAAWAKTRLVLHDNADGTLTGHFTVPTLAGSILRKVIQQLASPRRARPGATDAQAGPTRERDGSLECDWPHRYGLAFVELLEHLPTDRLHHKTAATIVIQLQHDQLLADLRGAGLDTGEEISAGQARRLACNAGILPAVLGGASLPLNLGRQQRFFSEPQRVALGTRHDTCAADGCDRPYAWCDLHHQDPWSHGGHTDLDKAIPLCGFHHRRIHDPAYWHRRHPDGTITFHRRT